MSEPTTDDHHLPPRKRHSHTRPIHADANSPSPPAFEDVLTRLDEIVLQLEGGQLSLDRALSLYEEGVRLYHLCQTMLDSADLRLERLRIAAAVPSEADDAVDSEPLAEPFELDER